MKKVDMTISINSFLELAEQLYYLKALQKASEKLELSIFKALKKSTKPKEFVASVSKAFLKYREEIAKVKDA